MKTRVLKIKFVGSREDIEEELQHLKERCTVLSQSHWIPNQRGLGFVCFIDVLKEEVNPVE